MALWCRCAADAEQPNILASAFQDDIDRDWSLFGPTPTNPCAPAPFEEDAEGPRWLPIVAQTSKTAAPTDHCPSSTIAASFAESKSKNLTASFLIEDDSERLAKVTSSGSHGRKSRRSVSMAVTNNYRLRLVDGACQSEQERAGSEPPNGGGVERTESGNQASLAVLSMTREKRREVGRVLAKKVYRFERGTSAREEAELEILQEAAKENDFAKLQYLGTVLGGRERKLENLLKPSKRKAKRECSR